MMHSCPVVTLTALALLASVADAQDRYYGRSVVATQYGIVATSQVSASQAGARVLEGATPQQRVGRRCLHR